MTPKRKLKIALFGGAFNPPHLAHRQVVEALVADRIFDEIWVTPSFSHPHEKILASFQDRVELCRLMIEGLPKSVSVSKVEAELGAQPSFTIDVVGLIKTRQPETEIFVVIGSDCQEDLATWKEINVLREIAHFYYVPRPGHGPSPFMDVSSTMIRDRLSHGLSIDDMVLPKVANYIKAHGLYHD